MRSVPRDVPSRVRRLKLATNDAPRDWSEFPKNLLKSEMKKVGFTYKNLVDALESVGVTETEANLRNKISRGGFSAGFFFQVMEALGCGFIVIDPFASRPRGDLPADQPARRTNIRLSRDLSEVFQSKIRKE